MLSLRDLPTFPVAVAQAVRVIRTAERLPEPEGERSGVAGAGPDLRLLVFGDSSAAGVGVATQEQALSGQLVQGLADRHHVSWRLLAESGATTGWGVRTLRAQPPGTYDVAVIALGVNDVKNGVPQRVWERNTREILHLLAFKSGVTRIYHSALPPLGRFPLLPDPLRSILGRRRDRFDLALGRIIADVPEARFIDLNLDLDESHMATDGFHPGPMIYAGWARKVCDAMLHDPLQRPGPVMP